MRRLVINGDDFGLTSGVNRAIIQAHQHGVVTSATLMAGGHALPEALTLLRSAPGLATGCHVVLVNGTPVLPASQISTVVEGGAQPAPRFHSKLGRFAVQALRGQFNATEFEQEATAQIRQLQNSGITVTHIDTHKHTHIFPAVLAPLLRAATACGVYAIRNPFAPVHVLAPAILVSRPQLWKRYLQVKLLRRFHPAFMREVRKAGLVTTEGTVGIEATGTLDQQLFNAIVENLPEGTWEFVCHPGYNDADLSSAGTRLLASRERELEVLTSAESRAAIARAGIQLVSFRELAQAS